MKKINIGVLGCANIAKRYVLPAINDLEQYKLHGIASRSTCKAEEYAKIFKTKAFNGYNQILDEDLDAVYIPLPNSLHYYWIKKSVNKNIHVLVEKSLACTLNEVVELNDLARQKNVVLVENFQFRFHCQLLFIKNLLESGRIGELRSIRSSFGFPPFRDKENIRYQKDLGGGALLDAGAYTLKISQMFLGSEIYVDSASLEFSSDKNVDIWGSAFLKQKNGKLTSQVTFGFDNYYQNSIEIWGSNGKITAPRIFTAAPGFEPSIILESDGKIECIKLSPDDHFKKMLIYFYNLVHSKVGLDDEYMQNINQARLIEELFEKAQ
ncbi:MULTISPECIES: Gfo/Idh/MocA family protein [Comamonadaceae]|uniref:Gfo/Idh/MocA family protein n=1 Tax=Comamonadaceae TaxID=80864 RepID=UPI00271E5480|nr:MULTISPECIES: Gfo/Idh/MocA family oxidoreductase [Comamonadaceae]MDO9145895.1 Gfo/Idh/MocA family oxidoreductase [Rhodoferax sp.]MDP3887636.1 Gfo/Idh/MocA family oxidoreductase [Hydrogenophaga sp.]